MGFESLLALPPGLPFEFGAIGVTTDELQVRAHIVIDALARAEMCWRADFFSISLQSNFYDGLPKKSLRWAQHFQNNLIKTNFPLLVELSEFHRTVLPQ